MPAAAKLKRRLFFALWPDDAVRRQIGALSRQICDRPVPEANLHLTLLFLGMQDDTARQCFCTAAGQVQAGPFTLTLDSCGGWVRKRIQWLGSPEPSPVLGELVETLVGALAGCGIEAEKRPFVPHVTLSRKAKNPVEGLAPAPVSWSVNDFVLAESVPSPGGVRYVVLERWKL
jgi:2'-5' RNA ligase